MNASYVAIEPSGARADSGTLRYVGSELSKIGAAANNTASGVGLTTNGVALDSVASSLNSTGSLVTSRAGLADSYVLAILMADPSFGNRYLDGNYAFAPQGPLSAATSANYLTNEFIRTTGHTPADMAMLINTIDSTIERRTLSVSVGDQWPFGVLEAGATGSVFVETQTFNSPYFYTPQALHRIGIAVEGSGEVPAGFLKALGGNLNGSADFEIYRELVMPTGTTPDQFASAVMDDLLSADGAASTMADFSSTLQGYDLAAFSTFDPPGAEYVGTGGSVEVQAGVGANALEPLEDAISTLFWSEGTSEQVMDYFFPQLAGNAGAGAKIDFGTWTDGSTHLSAEIKGTLDGQAAVPGEVLSAQGEVAVSAGGAVLFDHNGSISALEGWGAAKQHHEYSANLGFTAGTSGNDLDELKRVRSWAPGEGVSTHLVHTDDGATRGGLALDSRALDLDGRHGSWSAAADFTHETDIVTGERVTGWGESFSAWATDTSAERLSFEQSSDEFTWPASP